MMQSGKKVYTLYFCDKNEKYGKKLQEVLQMRGTFPFEVKVFTDYKKLFLQESSEENIIFLTTEEYETIQKNEKDRKEMTKRKELLILLENGQERLEIGIPGIYRYQSVDQIRKEILQIYGTKRGELQSKGTGRHKTKIIGVYSPIGRCLQTSFSLLMGQLLAKEKKVLYLNFEPFSGFRNLLGKSEDKDITDLVYSLHGKSNRLIFQIESMVSNLNGVDYIAPANSFMDLSSISEENWIILLQELKASGNYDYVILDLSEMVQGLLNVLQECTMIYTITKPDGFAVSKMMQYENLLMQMDYSDVLTKTKKCELPIFKKIPYELEQLPYSELAGYINKLIENEEKFQE